MRTYFIAQLVLLSVILLLVIAIFLYMMVNEIALRLETASEGSYKISNISSLRLDTAHDGDIVEHLILRKNVSTQVGARSTRRHTPATKLHDIDISPQRRQEAASFEAEMPQIGS